MSPEQSSEDMSGPPALPPAAACMPAMRLAAEAEAEVREQVRLVGSRVLVEVRVTRAEEGSER